MVYINYVHLTLLKGYHGIYQLCTFNSIKGVSWYTSTMYI